VDVDIAPFDLTARLDEARRLARTAMSAANQPGGILVAKYLDEVTDVAGLLALGAHRQDRLVGMLVGWPIANREWWRHHVRPALAATENLHWIDDAFELAELHVHPDLQGAGVGTALLEEAERRIDQQRIVLSTNAIDNWHAREFYRRRGFRTLTAPFRWLELDLRVFVLGREVGR
jgi:ribosomal protein S18 acetylase RimI-like enzyme